MIAQNSRNGLRGAMSRFTLRLTPVTILPAPFAPSQQPHMHNRRVMLATIDDTTRFNEDELRD
jgi:hypothetical protein